MACMKSDGMQLEFRCPECGVSGLTPPISDERAIGVTLKELNIRCPSCSAIIEVTEPLGRVMWKTRANVPRAVAEKSEELLTLLVRKALKAQLERRATRQKETGRVGQPDAPADGSQPSR